MVKQAIKVMKHPVSKTAVFLVMAALLILSLVYYAVPDAKNKTLDALRSSFVMQTAEAAGVADATADGTADNVQAQALVTALPASGGRLYMLTGTYVWANGTSVTRAIANVTISGTGRGTYLTGDGVTSPFTAGGNNWVLEDLRVQVTTTVLLTAMGATTGWEWRNITTSDGYYSLRSQSGDVVTDSATATVLDAPTTADYTIAAATASTQAKNIANETLDGASDETEINAAIVALNAAGVKRHLMLIGDFVADGAVTALSNVDVTMKGKITVTSNTTCNGIDFNAVTNAVWRDIEIHRAGVPITSDYTTGVATLIQGACDNTLQLLDYKSYNDCTGHNHQNGGINIYGAAAPIIDGFYAKGGGDDTAGAQNCGMMISNTSVVTPIIRNGVAVGGYGGYSNGLTIEECSAAKVYNVVGYGGTGTNNKGISCDNSGFGELHNCTGYGGESSGGSMDGIFTWGANSSSYYNCTGHPGKTPGGGISAGIKVIEQSSPRFIGCTGMPQPYSMVWWYDDADNGRFRPFSGFQYAVYSIQVYVSVATPGVTLDIGTTAAGTQIATGISLATAGVSPVFTATISTTVAANAYLYATPSGATADNSFRIYLTVTYRDDGCVGVALATTGRARLTGCNIFSTSSYGALYLYATHKDYKNWIIENSDIRMHRTDYGDVIYCSSPMTLVPIYNSRVFGQTTNIVSYASGSNMGAKTAIAAANETQIYTGSLIAGTTGLPVMAWQNPNAVALTVTARTLITTPAAAASVGDLGRATTVAVVEDAEDVWDETVDADYTVSVDTTYVERGTNCVKFVSAATISNGDLATEARAAVDLSTCTYLLLKARVSSVVAAGDLAISIDEDASCASPSFTMTLPALTANTTTLVCLAINGGAAAGATCDAVISIGLEYNANAKANTIYLDDIRGITVGTELFNDLPLNAAQYTSADSVTASAPLYVGAKNTDDFDCIVMYSQTNDSTNLVGSYYVTAQGQ